jgi:hypothetical protein
MFKKFICDIIWNILRFLFILNSRSNDPFKYLASILFDKYESDITMEERRKAKKILFQLIYNTF